MTWALSVREMIESGEGYGKGETATHAQEYPHPVWPDVATFPEKLQVCLFIVKSSVFIRMAINSILKHY